MAGSATYKPNNKGFAALAVSPKVRRAVHDHTVKGKAFAEGISQDFRDTGEYAAGFDVEDVTVEFKGRYGTGPRAASRLWNRKGYAAAVEWGRDGSSSDPSSSAHRVLGRTAEFLGSAEE